MDAAVVIPTLTRWGLSADADLVYRALALRGRSSANRLGRELGLARTRLQSALDELAGVQAARPSQVRTEQVWTSADVTFVLGVLRRRAERIPAPDERWRRHFAALDDVNLGAVAQTDARRLRSRALTRRRLAELVAAQRYESLSVNTEEVVSADSMAAAAPLDLELLRRGVRVRVLSRPPSDGDRGAPRRSVDSVPPGTYRQSTDLPMKMLIIDRKVALFPADPLNLEAGYVEISDVAAVQRLSAFFTDRWNRARDPFRQGVPPIDLNPRERVLIALLAAGHTDATAAAQMQVSVRTVAYTMRALMDRLGVENRFQLALLLGASGSTELPPVAPPASPDSDKS